MPLTHRMTGTGAHRSWVAMRQRCLNTKQSNHHRYGGRGITICPEWTSFEQFYKDMGDRPPGLSLERMDNNLGYCPENCRWSTKSEQAQNRRPKKNIKMITHKGESMTVTGWAIRFGLTREGMRNRIQKGWPND